ncbi:MAG: protease inhibitor I42 family protein [Terracidiphilus sp.]|jgi:inhibitor of cysteine peptidase
MHTDRSCRLFFVRGLFLFALLAFAFAPQAAIAANKVVTEADKGSVVHLKMGDTLEVRLKANPSTGYMWYITKESTPLMKLIHQTQTDPTEPGVGRPVFQVFNFEPRRGGEGALKLHYVRSWEPPSQDEERFEIQVVIE